MFTLNNKQPLAKPVSDTEKCLLVLPIDRNSHLFQEAVLCKETNFQMKVIRYHHLLEEFLSAQKEHQCFGQICVTLN